MNKTEWFPLFIEPERIGLYEVWEDDVGIVGKMVYVFGGWHWPHGEFDRVCDWNNFKWRGLKEPA